MCGFVGFTNNITNSKKVLTNMMDVIAHRGPDSDGEYISKDIALGFKRLSILDLENGNQPMFNEDETLVLTPKHYCTDMKNIKKSLLTCCAGCLLF